MKKNLVYTFIFVFSILKLNVLAETYVKAFSKTPELDSLLALLPSLKDTSLVNELNVIAVLYTKGGDSPNTFKYATKALEEAEKINFKRGIGTAYRNFGVYYKNEGDYKKALEYYNKAIAVSESENDAKSAAAGHNNVANIYSYTGEYDKSIESHFKSLKLKESIGDKKGIATTLNGIAGVYYIQGNNAMAEDYFKRALKIREEIGDKSGIAGVLNNIGGIYQVRGEHEKAIDYFQKALAMQLEMGEKRNIPNTFIHLGESYAMQKKYSEALKSFMDANSMYEKNRDKLGMATSSNNIGNVYMLLGDYGQAELWVQKALNMPEAMQVKSLLQQIYESLTEISRRKGDYKKALEYQTLVMQVKDTLLNEKTNKAIAETNTKYETEKKELQISSLEKDAAISEYEINKQKNFKYTFMAFSALIVILAFVLFRGYNSKKKANLLLAEQKKEIEFQKAIVDEKNKDITDSIIYAKRIQDAILPSSSTVSKLLPQSFILFRPKDIISGDFYWIEEKQNKVFFASVDCTGHGVPGALMSIVGYNLLNQAVNEEKLNNPGKILDYLNQGVSRTLQQKEEESTVKDGMDIALCSFSRSDMQLEFAGAFNSLYLIRDKNLKEIKGNKFPVGIFIGEEMQHFTNHQIAVQPGDTIYVFTDGYADQFGGSKGKKFKYKQLQEKLLQMQELNMAEQEHSLDQILQSWKGGLEQVDDILIMGIRI